MDSCVRRTTMPKGIFEVKGGCYLWQRVCALIEDLVNELVVVSARCTALSPMVSMPPKQCCPPEGAVG